MPLHRRELLRFAGAGAAALAAPPWQSAAAENYPTRPVRIIEGLGGGSTPNLVSRLIGQWLSEHLGQPFVVESRTGAGGNLAAQAV
ncbi:MAG: tripartite tricarboxylate transporter substrate binding protein, partial [Xanthobacteraceae bacterium]